MSRSPVPLIEQEAERLRLETVVVGVRKRRRVGTKDVPSEALRGCLDDYNVSRIVVRQKVTEIPDVKDVLLVSKHGIVRLTEKDGKVVPTLLSFSAPSVLLIGPSYVCYPGRGKLEPLTEWPTTARWQRLKEAHTPYYSESEFPTLLENHSALSVIMCCKVEDNWHVVLRKTSAGYDCMRCSRTFKSIHRWASHYKGLQISTSLPWTKLMAHPERPGKILCVPEKLKLLRPIGDRTEPSFSGTMMDGDFARAVYQRLGSRKVNRS